MNGFIKVMSKIMHLFCTAPLHAFLVTLKMTGGCCWGTLAFKDTPHSAPRIHLVFRECAWGRFLWPVLTSSAPLVFITKPFDIEYSWCLGKLRPPETTLSWWTPKLAAESELTGDEMVGFMIYWRNNCCWKMTQRLPTDYYVSIRPAGWVLVGVEGRVTRTTFIQGSKVCIQSAHPLFGRHLLFLFCYVFSVLTGR